MRLYSIKDEFGDRVSITMKGYPLVPGDTPGRRVSTHSQQRRMQAAVEAKEEGLLFLPWPEDKEYPRSSLPGLEAAKAVQLQGEEAFRRFDLALLKAFFEESRDISGLTTLLEVAEESGVDRTALERELASGVHKQAVISDFMECLQKYGRWAQAIPLQSFNGSPPMVGCAPKDAYRTAVERYLNPAAALGF